MDQMTKKKEHQFVASVQHEGHERKSNKYESSEYLTSSLAQTHTSFSGTRSRDRDQNPSRRLEHHLGSGEHN